MLTIIAVLASSVAWPGCTSTPKLTPKGRAVIPVETAAEHATATVKLLNEVVVQLPRLEKAGDEWTIVFNDSRFLKQLRPIERAPDGSASVTFLAIRVGRRALRFFALSAGAREAEPTQSYEVLVTIE